MEFLLNNANTIILLGGILFYVAGSIFLSIMEYGPSVVGTDAPKSVGCVFNLGKLVLLVLVNLSLIWIFFDLFRPFSLGFEHPGAGTFAKGLIILLLNLLLAALLFRDAKFPVK